MAVTALVSDFFGGCWSLVKGLDVTLRTMLRPAITVQYPTEKIPMAPRWRGVLSLEVSKCLSCQACVRACPAKFLSLKFHTGPDKKRVLDSLTWDNTMCAHCNLCADACPTQALAFHHDYEIASFTREDLFHDLAKGKTAEVGDLPHGAAPGAVATIAADGSAQPLTPPEQAP